MSERGVIRHDDHDRESDDGKCPAGQGQHAAGAGHSIPHAPSPVRQPHVPLRERVNLRMVLFILAIAAPVMAVAYIVVSQWVTGGVTRSGDYLEVDLKAMGYFPFDQQAGTLDNIPSQYRALDGKKVKLRGFMFSPQSAGDRGTEFQFVYNVTECCFKGPPQVQERVYGYAPKGKSISLFHMNQFAEVTGVLHVRIVRDKETGAIYSVYEMDVESSKAINL
jgi:hypothetical protein